MTTVLQESPATPDAALLLGELSASLAAITGCGGEASFDSSDMGDPRAVFAVARTADGEAVGCGAFRPTDEKTAEIKRVFAREKGAGTGSAVLAFLEKRARELGYTRLVLETRKVNKRAVAFYLAKGYKVIENYGKYKGRDEAICFEKNIPPVTCG